MFRAIKSDKFPPFGESVLRFPPVENKPDDLAEVHLLTGVNGTGKTRLLSVLAAMLGNPEPLLKRHKIGDGSDVTYFSAIDAFPESTTVSNYWNTFQLNPTSAGWQGGDARFLNWSQTVPAFGYSGGAYIVDSPIAVMEEVPRPNRAQCLSFSRHESKSKELIQAIANLKVQAAMDMMNHDLVPPSSRAAALIAAIEGAISRITDRSFRFNVTSYPRSELQVVWGDDRLPFNLLPDGLRSIIGWLAHAVVMMDVWMQGKGDPMQTEAVFLLDEIESHLHPAWQRRILPAFQRLFPKAQIFVATHSPFVIASINHGWIHRFTIKDGKVTVEEPRAASEGDSFVSVVEDIMGLSEWFDPETEKLLAEFRETRDDAYHGKAGAQSKAREQAAKVGSRSMELGYMMGRELAQMDRQLSQVAQVR